ncbi:MAG: hypothetical protein Q4D56_06610 [Bacteroides sp.]|nr:hypothetical protein [Bacteroides sp.]
MKNTFALVSILMLSTNILATNVDVAETDTLKNKKAAVVSNQSDQRNVMLNAEDNTSPREINIGLPGSTWGINILEDDLPVVYRGYPEYPNKTWRGSVGLSSNGLLQMNDIAYTLGDVGYAVNSYSMKGTKKFKLKGKLTTNTFGWLQGDINVSGPISKNGWTYTAGAFLNFDPGTTDLAANKYADETKIVRLGLTKYFAKNRGQINFLYKFSDSFSFGDYAVFQYEEGGKVSEIDGFKIGRDSYVLNTGKIRMLDMVTGEYYWAGTDGSNSKVTAHNIDINGNYLFNSGWNFKYSSRLHLAKAGLLGLSPTSITTVTAEDGYTTADGKAYSGMVGGVLAQGFNDAPITEFQTRLSLNKQINSHNVTVGLLEQFRHSTFANGRVLYYQTVEPQPEILYLSGKSDEYGFYNYNSGAAYHKGNENKFSIYAGDKWQVNKNLNIDFGLHLRWRMLNGEYTLTNRSAGFTLANAEISKVKDSYYNIGGYLNARYNLNRNFGLMANVLYGEDNGGLENYNTKFLPNMKKSKSPMGAVGIFWNNKYIQLVSQLSVLSKTNNLKRFNMVDPDNSSNVDNVQVYYKIQTIGWTTDFVLTPFKGFKLHYLLTIQNPQYKDFSFEAFNTSYNYSNKNVLSISKVLMEIDPSYSFGKRQQWRVWASFRYYSKQFANLTNVLYFAPHWETFGGVDYKLNKHINFSAQVVNFLNQRGAKGSINGAELITDPTPYYGEVMTGSYIMPLSGRLTVSINF